MNRWAVWVTVSRVHWDASGTIKTSQPWWLCAWLGVDGLEHDLGHLFMTGSTEWSSRATRLIVLSMVLSLSSKLVTNLHGYLRVSMLLLL